LPARELEVVRTADLAVILRRVIEEHEGDRPSTRTAGGASPFVSGRGWICKATGVSIRTLWTILEEKDEYTGLSMVDRIISGLELTHVWNELQVIPNPNVKTYEKLMRQRTAEL
jgi:hypothetical protein